MEIRELIDPVYPRRDADDDDNYEILPITVPRVGVGSVACLCACHNSD